MDFDELFETIITKQGNNENISVELNTLMENVKQLNQENENNKTKIAETATYVEKLKEANTNLLLSKGFVSKFEESVQEEETEDKPKDIKDFISFN
jgi:hypothetical protein